MGQDGDTELVLDKAIEFVEETGERFFESELWRLRGEYLWHGQGKSQEAEKCFLRALTIAVQQQSKSLELRAATSLAGLRATWDKIEESTELLEEVYGSFTEGFDTPDLLDARRLLESLHHSKSVPTVVAWRYE